MNEQNPIRESELMMTRRQLFGRAALGLGTAALADIIGPDLLANSAGQAGGTHMIIYIEGKDVLTIIGFIK